MGPRSAAASGEESVQPLHPPPPGDELADEGWHKGAAASQFLCPLPPVTMAELCLVITQLECATAVGASRPHRSAQQGTGRVGLLLSPRSAVPEAWWELCLATAFVCCE